MYHTHSVSITQNIFLSKLQIGVVSVQLTYRLMYFYYTYIGIGAVVAQWKND